MRYILFGFLTLSVVCLSCGKKDTTCNYNDSGIVAPASEIANVQAYLTANSITATQHPSGFFYKINQSGTGAAIVNLCSVISVKYAGKLTNGTYFDPTTPGTTSSATFTAFNKRRRKDHFIHSTIPWLWKFSCRQHSCKFYFNF
jgi:hypothetical protein